MNWREIGWAAELLVTQHFAAGRKRFCRSDLRAQSAQQCRAGRAPLGHTVLNINRLMGIARMQSYIVNRAERRGHLPALQEGPRAGTGASRTRALAGIYIAIYIYTYIYIHLLSI